MNLKRILIHWTLGQGARRLERLYLLVLAALFLALVIVQLMIHGENP